MEEAQSLVQVLRDLLSPMGAERRDRIVAMVEKEIATHAVVQFCWDKGSPISYGVDEKGEKYETGGPLVWEIGKPNPLDAEETVFAMFHWDKANCVCAFTFKPQDVNGRKAIAFNRSIIFYPVHVHGPVDHRALELELAMFIEPEPEPAPEPEEETETEQTNGAAGAHA